MQYKVKKINFALKTGCVSIVPLADLFASIFTILG